MEALDRIPSEDWPALQAYARLQDETLNEAAVMFEDQFIGEWPTLRSFARDRIQWEHNLPDFLVPFFNDDHYIEVSFGPNGCFMSIGHAAGVWIFQTAEEPSWFDEPDIPAKDPLGDPE